tara:strand:- start:655 stop:765 length:111 start_codon:yes stop_codon:yes gene_type:complete
MSEEENEGTKWNIIYSNDDILIAVPVPKIEKKDEEE